MRSTIRQRVGSGIAALGLSLLATAGAVAAAGPASAEVQTSPVCNQLQAGQDPATCHTGGPYGEVDWEVTGGQLVLHVTAADGMSWSAVRVCAPYGPPANGADCQPSDVGLLPTSGYTVEVKAPAGATASSQDGKKYEFAPCSSEFVITVPTSSIAGDLSDFWWAMHLAPQGCGANQTHEAFGRVRTATTTTTTAGNSTPTTSPTTTPTTGGDGPATTTTAAPVTVGGTTAPAQTEVLGEQVVQDTAVVVRPQVTATLPVTGARTPELLALAGLAFVLGGVAIRFGRPATQR